MAARVEDIVRTFCDAWGTNEAPLPNVDLIVDMFAEDGEWVLWVPGGPTITGRAAIRAEIVRQLTFSSDMRCGITKIVANGSTVMTERLDHFTMRGIRVAHALVAVFDLDDACKILSWREYFDTADIGRQLGIPADAVIEG
jgi:limonene-1,2-epoxide hydrolase